MFNSETTALLRSVLDEVCAHVSVYESGARAHVAAKLLEAAADGRRTIDDLRTTGREALKGAPAMWR